MNLLGKRVVLLVVKRQSVLLALPVKVVVDILAALYHQNLLAVPYLRLDYHLRVGVQNGIVALNRQSRQYLVLLLVAERYVLYSHEGVPRVNYPETDE